MKEQIVAALIDAINSIKNSELLTGATLLAFAGSIIAMVWAYGRKLISFITGRIGRLLMFRVTLEFFDDMYWYMETWLQENHGGKYRNVVAYLEDCNVADGKIPSDYDGPTDVVECKEDQDKTTKTVRYKHHSDFIIIRFNRRRIFISKNREKNESATTLKALFYDSFYISSLFGKKTVKRFMNTVLLYNLEKIKEKNDVNIYSRNWGRWYMLKGVVPKKLENIFLNGDIKNRILMDIEDFVRSEQFYIKKGIPYKRGYLFHGKPGNGKTTLAIALGFHLKRSLYIMNLASLSDDNDLIGAFIDLPARDVILLIEDIDTMFYGDRKVKKNKINFSTLLNCLDGVFYRHGIISIMTTNHIEKLDEAMIRKGRIDLMMEINAPDEITAKIFVESFYDGKITINGEFEDNLLPMSTIQELCISNTSETFKQSLR